MADKPSPKKIASFTVSIHGDGVCFVKANTKGAQAEPVNWEGIQRAIRKQLRKYFGYIIRIEVSGKKKPGRTKVRK